MTSANQYKNVLGIYPEGLAAAADVPPRQRRTQEMLVRLMGNMADREGAASRRRRTARPDAEAAADAAPPPKGGESPAAKMYKAKKGFANCYFNELERDQLLAAFKKHGDFTAVAGHVDRRRQVRHAATARATCSFEVTEGKDDDRPDREARS